MSKLLTIRVSDQVERFASQVAMLKDLPVEKVLSDFHFLSTHQLEK